MVIPASYLYKQAYHQAWEEPDKPAEELPPARRGLLEPIGNTLRGLVGALRHVRTAGRPRPRTALHP